MVLTAKQREELHKAIQDYFKESGFNNSLAEFTREACISSDEPVTAGLLEKKWTSVLRLQKKALELEQKLNAATEELVRLKGRRAGSSNPTQLPQVPACAVLNGHRSPITAVKFHPLYNVCVTSAEDATVKVWDYETGQYERTLKGHTDSVNDINFDHTGNLLISCSADLTLKLWNFGDQYACTRTMYGHEHTISSACFLPSGDHIVSASRDKSIKLWETGTGFCIRTFSGHDEWVRRVLPHPSGSLVASCSSDQSIRLWNVAAGTQLAAFREHSHVVECIAFAPAAMVTLLQELRHPAGQPTTNGVDAAHAVPAGYLITGSRDRTIKVWDMSSSMCIMTLEGHDNWVRGVVGHPSGEFIISASDDKSIRVWDVKTGRCVKTYEDAHNHFVTCVTFNPRLPFLATGSVDQTVKIWDCR
eukprot:gnl/Hemi2/15136_TR5109_c0_g1_i1.p1 gnl/Hemi2/15136_TR5109_c0_g1~~gnl/Hemi2/15136_TR5109_c0_g1_i1.p1  ORF type:complete len:449 (-),score=44.66 gnl/Hemi2/15136_TR5109_c0_g1_i1:276-1529(-)